MWKSSCIVALTLLALVVLSRVEVQPSLLDLICFKTTYAGSFLDITAREACTLKNKHIDSPPNCPSCLTPVPFYTGNEFTRDGTGHLLMYPLAKIKFEQRGEYFVVVLWNRENKICQAVGALYRVHGSEPRKCNKIKYLGWGDFFVLDEIARPDDEKNNDRYEYEYGF